MCQQRRFTGKWEWARLDELTNVDPENLTGSTQPDYSFNYISIDDVEAGRLLNYSQEWFETAPSRARRVVHIGDILMSTVRPLLQGHLFFCGQIANAVCSTGFAVLRAKSGRCEPQFLFAHLFSDVVNVQLQGLLTGSNYPAISSSDVRQLRVPCPPSLEEQESIAAVLSDVDDLVGALEALISKKRDIMQTVMQQILTGRTHLPGFDREWKTKELSKVAVVTMGQSPPSRSYNLFGDGLPLIQGKADIVGRNTTERIWTTCSSKHCAAGDIVLTVRAPVGSVARASSDVCLEVSVD